MYIFPKLRPYQAENLEHIKSSKAKWIIMSSPTGSGKSFYPAQLAYESHKTLSLVAVKSLQEQYSQSYDMTSLMGKANYPCLNSPEQLEIFGEREEYNAETCILPQSQMRYKCIGKCPYPIARQEFIESIAGVTNYAKFLLDGKLIEQFEPEYLFLDEAHLLSDVTVDFAGLVFNWNSKEFQKYGRPLRIDKPQPLAFIEVKEWLRELLYTMKENKPAEPHKGGNLRSWLWHKRRVQAISNTLHFMQSDPPSWYIESDKDGLRIRPLTARFNFTGLFDRAEKIVLMSATIDKHALRELGIADYEFIQVPNPYPPPLRVIDDLGCPRIGYRSSLDDLKLQAKGIANYINKCPDSWTGLIHVSSKSMAYDLCERLSVYTTRPFYIPPRDVGTEEVYNSWQEFRDDGTIGIFWQAWEGWDCGKDKINIMAKVPFVDFSGGFDTIRFQYDGKAGYSRTAAKMIQGLGRNRRGNPEDYGSNKRVAIADGNWTRLRKYIAPDILESIS